MTLDSTTAEITLSSWGKWWKYPTKSRQKTLSVAEWNAIVQAADLNVLMKLDSVVGCPDCRDQGGEWIEIERGGLSKRVVFEYGAKIEPIAPLLAKVRAVRERFWD